MKLFYLIPILFLSHSFGGAINFKAGDIQKATIVDGFKVSNSLKGFPVLISFGWNEQTYKRVKREIKSPARCILVANANPDFTKKKSYLYIDRIECDKKNIEISAYITDTRLDFGIKSKFINFNTSQYLKVDGGTKVFVVITQVNGEKIQISDSGH